MSLQLGHIILYVPDVNNAVEFYKKAFQLECEFVDESGQYAQMKTGACALGFASEELARDNLKVKFTKNSLDTDPAGIEISLISNDVNADYLHALENGCVNVVEPQRKPWGQVVGYVRDLNGILVEISTTM